MEFDKEKVYSCPSYTNPHLTCIPTYVNRRTYGSRVTIDGRARKGVLGDEGLDAGDGSWDGESGCEANRFSSSNSVMDLSVLVEMKCVT